MKFKYAHLADLHLGSWREDKMRDLSTKAFLRAMEKCKQEKVDFILFAGDIFNTSLPALDTLKIVTKTLKELHDASIPIYTIAGSHDFSPSGKTMIDVLENAGLLINVCKGTVDPQTNLLQLKFTQDPKTQAKITGMLGRKGQLDKFYYQNLSRDNLEQELGYKIFMFHTTISEMKPKHLEQIEGEPVSFLPQGCNYYAGGHIHHPTKIELPGYGTLTYPGALFPNNFAEIEKYSHGGFYIITVNNNEQDVTWVPIEVNKHHHLEVDCAHKSPEIIMQEMRAHFQGKLWNDTLITLRLSGTLQEGKVTDLNFKEIYASLYEQGAYWVMKNATNLSSPEFQEIKIAESNPELIEERLIQEHLQQSTVFGKERENHLIKSLLAGLNTMKREGETSTDFQKRIETEAEKIVMQQSI
ncbi:MAG TPA: exonuclease SbcCD subunit D [Candidatus Nanoarchaeia archaeon]|nr:exonuclease SbcCD subunit D [Candidatus Nanoarchaeia archaeon]